MEPAAHDAFTVPLFLGAIAGLQVGICCSSGSKVTVCMLLVVANQEEKLDSKDIAERSRPLKIGKNI